MGNMSTWAWPKSKTLGVAKPHIFYNSKIDAWVCFNKRPGIGSTNAKSRALVEVACHDGNPKRAFKRWKAEKSRARSNEIMAEAHLAVLRSISSR